VKNKKIPWVDVSEQPEYSSDIFPRGFFNLYSALEDIDDKNEKSEAEDTFDNTQDNLFSKGIKNEE